MKNKQNLFCETFQLYFFEAFRRRSPNRFSMLRNGWFVDYAVVSECRQYWSKSEKRLMAETKIEMTILENQISLTDASDYRIDCFA